MRLFIPFVLHRQKKLLLSQGRGTAKFTFGIFRTFDFLNRIDLSIRSTTTYQFALSSSSLDKTEVRSGSHSSLIIRIRNKGDFFLTQQTVDRRILCHRLTARLDVKSSLHRKWICPRILIIRVRQFVMHPQSFNAGRLSYPEGSACSSQLRRSDNHLNNESAASNCCK